MIYRYRKIVDLPISVNRNYLPISEIIYRYRKFEFRISVNIGSYNRSLMVLYVFEHKRQHLLTLASYRMFIQQHILPNFMQTYQSSALLVSCMGNPPVTGGFPSLKPCGNPKAFSCHDISMPWCLMAIKPPRRPDEQSKYKVWAVYSTYMYACIHVY